MWIAKGVDSKKTSGRKILGFLESVGDCTVDDGNGRKEVFGTQGLGIFRNVENRGSSLAGGKRLANPRNYQRIRKRSPKLLVIVVGTLNITVLNVNIRNIRVMHVVGYLKRLVIPRSLRMPVVHRDC